MLDTLLAAVGRLADSHADRLGVAATPVLGLTAVRSDGPGELQYAISRPLVALVVQGSKRVTLGTQTFDFGAGDSMVVAADVPTVSQITRADPGAPQDALVIHLLPPMIESLTLEMGIVQAAQGGPIRIDRTESEVAKTKLGEAA